MHFRADRILDRCASIMCKGLNEVVIMPASALPSKEWLMMALPLRWCVHQCIQLFEISAQVALFLSCWRVKPCDAASH